MAGTAVMKIRSCLMVACLAIVPLVAMFSHKVPREWRLALQRVASGGADAAKPGPSPDPAPDPELQFQPQRESQPQPPAGVPLAVDVPPAAAPLQERVAQPAALVPITPVAATRVAIEDQLRTLGAVAIECVPMMQGASYRCSCRVPADPSGQLQRVFQSSNPDPVVALKNLHGQVQFWKHRLATSPDIGNPLRTPGDGSRPALR